MHRADPAEIEIEREPHHPRHPHGAPFALRVLVIGEILQRARVLRLVLAAVDAQPPAVRSPAVIVDRVQFVVSHQAQRVAGIAHRAHRLQCRAHASRHRMAGLGIYQVSEEDRLPARWRHVCPARFLVAQPLQQPHEFVVAAVDIADDVVVVTFIHGRSMDRRYRLENGGNRGLYDSTVMNEFERLFAISGLSLDRLRTFLRVAEAGNLARAAAGNVTMQSQFSRQIKELEAYFGVALTRRVGRRVQITEEGMLLARVIRRQFVELDDFRESMAGRSVNVRLGAQGSLIGWLLVPQLSGIRTALGNATVEMEQMRSADVVRSVADGRLDFGIVREDAVPPETRRWRIGEVGYSLFAANSLWKKHSDVRDLLRHAPVAELLPGGQLTNRWHHWLEKESLSPKVLARVSSFLDLTRIVQSGQAAAALPDLAAVDFDPRRVTRQPITSLRKRTIVLLAHERGLDRSGIPRAAAEKLAATLKLAKEGKG
ncbi:MAG: LysR family transcriptional regulator [Verrucomicrobiaceae bacterium]|nr:MAG: LysR family transcriptional regulator [Verrucomicrobiaceae bacterium]